MPKASFQLLTLLCPLPEDLPNPGIEHRFPALQADSLPTEPPGKLVMLHIRNAAYYYFSEHTCKWHSLFLFIIKREKQDHQVLRGRMDLEENL